MNASDLSSLSQNKFKGFYFFAVFDLSIGRKKKIYSEYENDIIYKLALSIFFSLTTILFWILYLFFLNSVYFLL